MWGVILNVLTRRVQWYVQFMSKRALSALSAWRALKINFLEHGHVGCHFEGLGKESSMVCAICKICKKNRKKFQKKFAKFAKKIRKKFQKKIRKIFLKKFAEFAKKIATNLKKNLQNFKVQRYM